MAAPTATEAPTSETDIEREGRVALVQAVLDRGKAVWVMFGVYSDRSGSKILGVYTDQSAAEDRVKLAREAGAAYQINYVKCPLDKTFGVELNP